MERTRKTSNGRRCTVYDLGLKVHLCAFKKGKQLLENKLFLQVVQKESSPDDNTVLTAQAPPRGTPQLTRDIWRQA